MKKSIAFFIALMLIVVTVFASACEIVAPSDNLPSADEGVINSADEGDAPVVTDKTVDLMRGIVSADIQSVDVGEEFTTAYNDFAAQLFKSLYEGNNELISPLSIEIALAMVANGAAGETKTQMEKVLFDGINVERFNKILSSYVGSIQGQDGVSIKVANSIWIKDDPYFSVKQAFLQTNADYYAAQAYKAPFNDETLADVNGWVNDKTDGMINKILDDISKDAVMYLINAVLFDAEWSVAFDEEYDYKFTCSDKAVKDVTLMLDEVSGYVSDDVAEGFIKSYKGSRFGFAALLPKENKTVSEVVAAMTGKTLTDYFKSRVDEKVVLKMPKFKLDFKADLNDCLKALGMPDAFDKYLADFSALGEYRDSSLYIDFVKHKTAIEVGEVGTKAAAVTAVGVKETSVGPMTKTHYITLDRPFLYFIVDTKTNTPLFMGAYEK